MAEEVRSLLARLGFRSLNEIITGRTDLLQPRSDGVALTKTDCPHLSTLLDLPDVKIHRTWLDHGDIHSNGPVLDDEMLADADVKRRSLNHGTVQKTFSVLNTDRTIGARVAGAIARAVWQQRLRRAA
jgi:glutamate synthase (ferredoxin)